MLYLPVLQRSSEASKLFVRVRIPRDRHRHQCGGRRRAAPPLNGCVESPPHLPSRIGSSSATTPASPRFVGTISFELFARVSPSERTRRDIRIVTVRIPQSTHLRYTYVYIGIPLKNSTESEISHSDQIWIHPIAERPRQNYTTGSRAWHRLGIIAK